MSAKITKRQLFNGHSSPTKTTPEKPVKKKHALGVIKTSKKCQWTVDEEKALVEYISLSKLEHEFSEWPYMKASSPFWIEAAAEVNKVGLKGRTGSACRQRTVEGENSLKARFGTLEKAEMKFGILQVDLDLDHIGTTTTQSQSQSTLADGLQTPQILRVHNSDIPPLSLLTSPEVVNMLSPEVKSTVIEQVFSSMSASDQLSVLKSLVTSTEKKNLLPATEHSFQSLLLHRNVVYPPNDYVQLSTDVMLMLQSRNEDNIPYELLKAIGLKRDDGSPRMPLDRMPYPMICYAIKFFNSSAPSQVKCPEIYLQWLDTMYANFGERFVQLYRGPCWSGVSNGDYHTQNAKVNIPSVSTRRLRVRAEENEFKADTSIQTSALQQLKQISPGTRVWIKADGTDMHPVLQESKRQLWHGDVDICDGNLAALYRDYNDRRNRLKSIVKTVNGNVGSLQRWHEDLQDDRVFLREGQKTAVAKFNKKQGDNNTPESTLMRLSWEVHEYTMLHQICDEYIDVCACYLQQINEDAQCSPNVIAAIRDELNEMLEYLRNLYKKKRTAASHVLVFMVADEQRQTKPYALPVRYILYDSLKDSTYQRLMDEVKKEIVKAGLKPIGSVTDGEFNSCRYNSISGKPTSVFKLRMMAKDKVSRLHPKTLLEMLLTRRVNNEGIHVTERHNPAIPQSTIARVDELLARGWSMRDVLLHIRQGQFPHEDYAPYPWRANTPESQTDLLRSIFAQFEFKALVSAHSTAEHSFHIHAYIPALDEDTKDFFHDREDHNHILKRIAQHTRSGGPDDINLQAFKEALEDSRTGLTYPAFKGLRKQSVEDAERLLSYPVANFMEEQGYEETARYVRVVAGWHEASDGRGLSQLQRQKYNYNMLNLILEELMPWYRDVYDFATVDINRPLQGIKGFSRETIIAVVTNIESQEFRRRQIATSNLPQEHPRAGTTDDVECFFSLLRKKLGDSFTHKQFKSCWRSMCSEFCKKSRPDLPFHYFTASSRYRDENEPNFDESDETPRLHQVQMRYREDGSIFAAGRAQLPVRNHLSVRARFHRTAVDLPPPPGYERTGEHDY